MSIWSSHWVFRIRKKGKTLIFYFHFSYFKDNDWDRYKITKHPLSILHLNVTFSFGSLSHPHQIFNMFYGFSQSEKFSQVGFDHTLYLCSWMILLVFSTLLLGLSLEEVIIFRLVLICFCFFIFSDSHEILIWGSYLFHTLRV